MGAKNEMSSFKWTSQGQVNKQKKLSDTFYYLYSCIQKLLGLKKNMCVYCHMSKKSRVSINFFLSAKPEIVAPGSWIRFRYFIFKISSKPSFVLKLFYDELRSFSTFFALNFDKKLAVE